MAVTSDPYEIAVLSTPDAMSSFEPFLTPTRPRVVKKQHSDRVNKLILDNVDLLAVPSITMVNTSSSSSQNNDSIFKLRPRLSRPADSGSVDVFMNALERMRNRPEPSPVLMLAPLPRNHKEASKTNDSSSSDSAVSFDSEDGSPQKTQTTGGLVIPSTTAKSVDKEEARSPGVKIDSSKTKRSHSGAALCA